MDTGAPPAAVLDRLVGRRLDGRYRLDRPIARGGMATVYTATDSRLDRVVAVKVMHRAFADDPDFVARFTREARAAARLSSSDVVAVHDQGTDADIGSYLVMEYVDGGNLRDLLRDQGAQAPGRALDLMVPVLRALAAAHYAGLVHRDVKPENVLLGRDGRVKVADFGLARAVETSTQTTGFLLGTVAYLSPEQVEHGVADPRSDVYAAGILLFELLTGAPPYDGGSPLSVAYRHVNEDVPPPSTIVAAIPPAADQLVQRATRRDPAGRPVDAGALLAELTAVRSDLSGPVLAGPASTLVVPRPPLTRSPPRRRARPEPDPRSDRGPHRRAVLTGLGALLLAGALAGGWWLASGRYVPVPQVVGDSRAQAEAELREQGFRVRAGREVFAERPAGAVVAQDPAADSRDERGSTVTLTVSKGLDLRVVPGVVGQQQAAATAALRARGLTVGAARREYAGQPVGEVLRVDPVVGARLRPGTPVTLVVSRGVERLPVPRVVGQSAATAGKRLQDSGFRSSLSEVFSDTVPRGQVVAQQPAGGQAARGAVVELQVSKGPELVRVPSLTGLERNEATTALADVGLTGRAIDLPDGGGVVVTQSPRAQSPVRKGTTVTFYVF